MNDFLSSVFESDIYKGARKGLDLVGMAELPAVAQGGGFPPGADKVLKPLGYATSAIDLGRGADYFHDSYENDDPVAFMDGIHDTVSGTAGMMGNLSGPWGAGAKAFSAGFAVGDMIAPAVFGSEEEDNGAHSHKIPADGVFKPSTGNQYVDGALDIFGIRD